METRRNDELNGAKVIYFYYLVNIGSSYNEIPKN